MSGYEIAELGRIEDALDGLSSPTSEDVFQATRPFDERAIASVAATRAGSGGGGSQPSVEMLGPYTFAFDTPDLASDYIPLPGGTVLPVGTVLFGFYLFATEDWNGEGGRVQLGIATSDADFTQLWRMAGASFSASGPPEPGEIPDNNPGGLVGLPNIFLYLTMDSVASQGEAVVYVLAHVPA